MATKKKLLQAAAGNAGGAGLDADEVFSTYLYDGNGATQTITNGIDLSGEGGLVWFKNRETVDIHALFDSERPLTNYLRTNGTNAEGTGTTNLSFNSNGFSFNNNIGFCNTNGQDYVSWTFRKAPKFFDIVSYTGSDSTQTINHSLGSEVGFMVVKRWSSGTGQWYAHHRSLTSAQVIKLNSTDAASNNASSLLYNVTSTSFTVDAGAYHTNAAGENYVAYLFAHNDGDGGFGPDADQDIIKCGSFTTDSNGHIIDENIGFEPQWMLLKSSTASVDNWEIVDVMRGWGNGGGAVLNPNASSAEYSTYYGSDTAFPQAQGFTNKGLYSNQTYIYVAIRRPTAVPESATEVFAIDQENTSAPYYTSGFPIDMGFFKRKDNASGWYLGSRLIQGKELVLNTTAAEGGASNSQFDYMDGWSAGANASDVYSWMWKRASGYMDVVAYTGNGTAGRTVSHNLTVPPEMMWVKRRNGVSSWITYWASLGATKGVFIDTNTPFTSNSYWNDTAPTDSVFSLGSGSTNTSGATFIAYLFATLAGISKVGSVTHSGTTNVDCGFSAGSRFVLLKRTDATGDWYVWDSVRGIVSGNDPYLLLNTTAAEVTNTDYIDPLSSGFTITSSLTAGDYIFYAIA